MEKLKFTGFHATSQVNANKIITSGFVINEKRNNDWLGNGIYMFSYKIDAESWANKTHYCKK